MCVVHRKVDGREACVEVGWGAHRAVERLAHVATRVKAVRVEGGHHVWLCRVRAAVVERGRGLVGPVLQA